MRLKAQPVAAILVTTSVIAGCSAQNEPTSPSAVPEQTEQQAEPQADESPASEELVKEDASTEDKKDGESESGSSVEQKVVAEWEEVMGQKCDPRVVIDAGSAASELALDPGTEVDEGLHGPLQGDVIHYYCERSDSSSRAEAPLFLTLRFFDNDADQGSDVDINSGLVVYEDDYYWNQDEKWNALAKEGTVKTDAMMERMGASLTTDPGNDFQP